LTAILASNCLRRAPALTKFLSFICEESLNGHSGQLKEYTIAVEALGRPDTFQPIDNPIVRVQAARLRECLKDFYRGEGRDHRVRIRLPKGQYAPEFFVFESKSDEKASVGDPLIPGGIPIPEEDLRRWRRSYFIAAALILCVVVMCLFLILRSRRPGTAASDVPLPAPGSLSVASEGETIRILAGYANPQYIDQLGRKWSGDRFFKGGRAEETVFEPILRVEDRNLWLHFRGGEAFQYDIPLKSQTYELHLYFAEPVYGVDTIAGGGETARIFDVFANNRQLLQSFDVLGDAGGPRTTDEKVFNDIAPAPDGLLHLRFAARTSEAVISAIELIPALPHRMQPIRITTRNTQYSSSGQVLWQPDRYYSGGRIHPLVQPVTGTDDPGLYSTERFGNFNYSFPVAEGSYTAILHLSEAYHGPSNPGGGGVGSRIFDVYFNGVTLLKDFDIDKEAGGANRALRKEFHGLKPNALGKLVFTFQPIRNYPCVNAIEIIPE
jgi:hypothetical protein